MSQASYISSVSSQGSQQPQNVPMQNLNNNMAPLNVLHDGAIVQMNYGTGLVTYINNRPAILPVILQSDRDNNIMIVTRTGIPTQFLPNNQAQWPNLQIIGSASPRGITISASASNSVSSSMTGSTYTTSTLTSTNPQLSINMNPSINTMASPLTTTSSLSQHSANSNNSGINVAPSTVPSTSSINGNQNNNSATTPLLPPAYQEEYHELQSDEEDDDEEDDEDNDKHCNYFAVRLLILVCFAVIVLVAALWLGQRSSYDEITPIYLMFNGVLLIGSPTWARRVDTIDASGIIYNDITGTAGYNPLGDTSSKDPSSLINITSSDLKFDESTAFVVGSDGRFYDVGTDTAILENPDYANLQRINLEKKVVMPGIGDAHGHLTYLGLSLITADISGCNSPEEVVQVLLLFCEENNINPNVNSGHFLTAWGWNEELYTKTRMKTKASQSLRQPQSAFSVSSAKNMTSFKTNNYFELINLPSYEMDDINIGAFFGHQHHLIENLEGSLRMPNSFEKDDSYIENFSYPKASELDAAFPKLPVVLDRYDGHAVWANTAAMSVVDIPKIDPPNGRIDRDEKGNPLGCFFDEAIMIFKSSPYNAITMETRTRALKTAASVLSSLGVTTVHHHAMVEADYLALKPLVSSIRSFVFEDKKKVKATSLIKTTSGDPFPLTKDTYPLRVYGYIDVEVVCIPSQNYSCPSIFPTSDTVDHTKYLNNPEFAPTTGLPLVRSAKNGRLTAGGAKFFLDGSLSNRGAALKEVYSDDQETRGVPKYTTDSIKTIAALFFSQKYQLAFHAIGDYAVAQAMEVLKFLNTLDDSISLKDLTLQDLTDKIKNGTIGDKSVSDLTKDYRYRIEHAQVVDSPELAMFSKLLVIPSIQPTHATSDMIFAETRLGETRLEEEGYFSRTFLDVGSSRVPFGTDFPVQSPNPWRTLHSGVTRRDDTDNPPDGFKPTERMTVARTIQSMTSDVAYAKSLELYSGSIEKNKYADFIILPSNQNPLTIQDTLLSSIRPILTFLDGNLVYAADVVA